MIASGEALLRERKGERERERSREKRERERERERASERASQEDTERERERARARERASQEDKERERQRARGRERESIGQLCYVGNLSVNYVMLGTCRLITLCLGIYGSIVSCWESIGQLSVHHDKLC